MNVNYRKGLSSLSVQERDMIENEIVKFNEGFNKIAQKYHLSEKDVKIIAIDMGLLEQTAVPGYVPRHNTKVDKATPIITQPESVKKVVAKKRKSRHDMNDEFKLMIAEELEGYQKNKWQGFNKKKFIDKFDISMSSLDRIAKSFNIILPSQKKVAKNTDNPAPEVIKETLVAKDIIPLSTYIDDKVVSVKFDNSVMITGINYVLFYNTVSSNKKFFSYDYQKPIDDFFKRLVEKKGIYEVKVYFNSADIDIKIATYLAKWCFTTSTNLTYIINGKENKIITEFGHSLSENIDYFLSKPTVEKYLYHMTFDMLIRAEQVFFLNISFRGRNAMIICPDYSSLVELFSRELNEARLDGKIKMYGALRTLVKGVPTNLLNFTNEKIYS